MSGGGKHMIPDSGACRQQHPGTLPGHAHTWFNAGSVPPIPEPPQPQKPPFLRRAQPSEPERLQDGVVGGVDGGGDRDLADGQVGILQAVAGEHTDNGR